MPGWKLSLKRSVLDDLRRLPKEVRARAALAILALCESPFGPGAEKLSGYERTFRLRVGDYRILYEVSGESVMVIGVRDRKEVYRHPK